MNVPPAPRVRSGHHRNKSVWELVQASSSGLPASQGVAPRLLSFVALLLRQSLHELTCIGDRVLCDGVATAWPWV